MPGWWASEDGRENGPLLQQSQWHEALLKAGFSGADMSLAENDDPTAHRMSTIVSTKPREKTPSKDMMVVITTNCSESTKVVASEICSRFRELGHSVAVKDLRTAVADTSGKTIISLLEYEDSFFENAQQVNFEHAKHLLLHSQEVLWITRSNPVDGPGHPAKRMISGLMRCLKMEDTSRRLYELHLSRPLGSDAESTGASVCQRLCTIWAGAEDNNALPEMETEEREGHLCVPRYMPYKAMNDSLARTAQTTVVKSEVGCLIQADRPLKMTIGQPGMLDTLHFVDDDACLHPLLEQDVEIEIKTCALNFL